MYRRLQRLFHHGYLDRVGENPNAPNIYALGARGAELLEVPRRKEVTSPYVAHRLMVGDFRINLTLACRTRGILLSWRSIPRDLPVRPDGFFTLQFPWLPDGRNRAHFVLEADRSTMPRERFIQKMVAYADWYTVGGHSRVLGIKTFRVLTVTKSEARVASLVTALAPEPRAGTRHGAYWFAPLTDVVLRPLDCIWLAASGSPGHSLIPPV